MTYGRHTVVLIHGLRMTPGCWEPFRNLYEERQYQVIAPPWARLHGNVKDIRRDPSALAGFGVAEIVTHYENAARLLREPPITIGHSLGGSVVEIPYCTLPPLGTEPCKLSACFSAK